MTTTIKSDDSTTIAFDRLGDGPALILVHPAFGHRAFDPPMAQLAAQLAARFTVYTYDRRGRGESGDGRKYAVEREIEDLAALINEAGGSAWLYGMSSGAVLALEAARSGLPIDGLLLYEPPFIVDDTRPPYTHDYVARLARLVADGRRGDAVAYAMTNAGVPEPVLAQMPGQPFWGAFEAVAHTLVYDGMVMGDTQRGDAAALECFRVAAVPTLVIVGSRSPSWARNAAEALATVLPAGRFDVVEAEFHTVEAATAAPILEVFISGRKAAPAEAM
jgi:pimeloyl-ACP methyl ester carboxylesterase